MDARVGRSLFSRPRPFPETFKIRVGFEVMRSAGFSLTEPAKDIVIINTKFLRILHE